MVKLIIFDWDDVFTLGSTKGYLACYHSTLKSLHVKLDPKEEKRRIIDTWGQSYSATVKMLLREHPELVKKGCKVYLENLLGDTYIDKLRVVSGSRSLLLRLRKKYIIALASGVHPALLKGRIMKKFNIPNVFSYMVFAQNLTPSKGKPSPFMIKQIIKQAKVSKDDTIMVGDATNDVLMAQNAGVEPIVVLTGHLNRKEAKKLGVDRIINDVTDLEEVL